MKKIVFSSLLLVSCASSPTHQNTDSIKQSRSPQSSNDLLNELKGLKAEVESGRVSTQNCHEYFQKKQQSLKEEDLQSLPADQAQELSRQVMLTTWQARLAIHQQLPQLLSCRSDLYSLFYLLRGIEDLASLKVYPDTQMAVADFKNSMQDEPIPLVDNAFYKGYLGPSGQVEIDNVNFQSGDLMLTRGGSFFSAILSSITTQPGQIDHFVLVHKDEVGKLETIESYAQTQPSGVQAFEMDYALKNENPRIVLLRPKDSKIGARAADIMSREAKAGKADPTKQIAYDYTMSFADDKHMTCSAVSYWGYYKASDGKFIIPEMRSTPNPKLTQLYSKTGINPEPMLTAADMELDSRFDLLLEFRDHRLISDSRLREAVAQSLFKWMSDLDYTIRPGFKSFVIDDIIFPLHKTKLWPMIKGLTGLSIPPDAPEGFIETLDALNSISDVLYKRVFDENSKYFKQSGWNMTHNQMMAVLETYRQADYQKCRSSGVTQFHQAFTSRTCLPKTNR